MVNHGGGGTCAQDLQQLVNDIIGEFLTTTASSNAPEPPAPGPRNDADTYASGYTTGCFLVHAYKLRGGLHRVTAYTFIVCVHKKHAQALLGCAQGNSPRQALKLDCLKVALRQVCHHNLEHLQANSRSCGSILQANEGRMPLNQALSGTSSPSKPVACTPAKSKAKGIPTHLLGHRWKALHFPQVAHTAACFANWRESFNSWFATKATVLNAQPSSAGDNPRERVAQVPPSPFM